MNRDKGLGLSSKILQTRAKEKKKWGVLVVRK